MKLFVGTTAPPSIVLPSIFAESCVLVVVEVETGAKAEAEATKRENKPTANFILNLLLVKSIDFVLLLNGLMLY